MNIVFLDIDGVLQPYDSDLYFYDDKRIIKELSSLHKIDYSKYYYYNVISAAFDWDKQAISRLKYILDETKSHIIISSDWRDKNQPDKMKALLTIHGLNKYYFADNEIIDYKDSRIKRRALEIQSSLDKYHINNFAILDDFKELKTYYPNNAVITNNIISIDNMNECIRILKKK